MKTGNTKPPTKSAAVYVSKSTKHRQFSIRKQMRAIRKYARHRGLEIVKEYSDAGKTGLQPTKQTGKQVA
jgi:DNA invertase Pin-like site-specific DNA recombinase